MILAIRPRLLLPALAFAACCSGPEEIPPPWPGQGTIATDDGRLWVHVTGDPAKSDVMVTVHGGPGMASDYLRDLDAIAEPTATHRRTLAIARYDQRGCGESLGFDGAGQGIDAHVIDLLAVCRAVAGDRPVHLLGHSWGGLVAAVFAGAHPGRVRSLTLFASFPAEGTAALAADVRMAAHLEELAARGAIKTARPLLTSARAFRETLPAYFHDPGFEAPSELRDASFTPSTYFAALAALSYPRYDVAEQVAAVRCPVLIVIGESDPFGAAMGRSMAASLRRANVEWFDLPGCGHFWHENPQPFFARLRQFQSP